MYKKILVPLNGSELAEDVLPQVISIAEGCGAGTVVLLRTVEPFYMPGGGDGPGFSQKDIERINSKNKAAAENYLGQVISRTKCDGINIQTKVIFGRAADSIAEYANKNDVDLIAIANSPSGLCPGSECPRPGGASGIQAEK
jgi:nucleotide-binding universal stress UspA family protein